MYQSDKPINNIDEDLLGRVSFSTTLAKAIINGKFSGTMCIGLLGSWGCGKTSIINMTLREIESAHKNDVVVVHFEPWIFNDENQLICQFFKRLSSEFGKLGHALQEVGVALDKYSAAFSILNMFPAWGNAAADVGEKAAKMAAGVMIGNSDISAQKEKIISLLAKQKKKTLIIIDDIDRLTASQIRAVFQLVASVANFPNIIYLLSFDENVVVEALKNVQTGDGYDYLQKIIQVPLRVPMLRRNQINTILIDRLNIMLQEYGETSFHEAHWRWIFPNCIEPFLNNIRDINRLCNLLEFKFAALYEDIDFADMVALTTIEVVNPFLFQWIVANKDKLTGRESYRENVRKLDTGHSNTSIQDNKKIEFYNDLSFINDSYSERTKENYYNCITTLFERYGGTISYYHGQEESRLNNYISHPDKVNRYFQLDLSGVAVSTSEISYLLNEATVDDIFAEISRCESKEKLQDIFAELQGKCESVERSRKNVIIEGLVLCYSSINERMRPGFLEKEMSYSIIEIMNSIVKSISMEDRVDLLISILKKCNTNGVAAFAEFLYEQEFANDRLERKCDNTNKIILDVEGLEKVERIFFRICIDNVHSYSPVKFRDGYRTLFMIRQINEKDSLDYFQKLFQNNENILYYLRYMSSHRISHEEGYSFEKLEFSHFTKERFDAVLHSAIVDKTILEYDDEVQIIAASYQLWNECDKDEFSETVYVSEAKERIKCWQSA